MVSDSNELFVTADGSHSLRSTRFDVSYHSVHGAIQESQHVFIEAGLNDVLARPGVSQINILEMGFGTGLNALLTQLAIKDHPEVNVTYYAYERYPLGIAPAAALNYPQELDVAEADFLRLHEVPTDGLAHEIAPNFSLAKVQADFLDGLPSHWAAVNFDLLYYDAFAPASQPELWTPVAMDLAHAALADGGIFVTYCAKGQFKRDLRDAGFTVEPLPGPPGKREMTRGRK
ncbi:tRNA (5-methylaminomethyl-2-thiouridine)(34)-methyltransferase MnmD [Lewinella sp. 4G2]|uniref:tRNA (5-methylaminomethyl-2-thiouridine)(34)-methyltransferase MnmD n=1 Tax=Lewinella sp. 4G2 TaxID=1803372 RepID=UPI0007B47BA8|nr:tRNA (5-methylaminomethyl-2-thiouridine)(34)-methyltransferase MnmD [Lewinella sp. 4G2]OAV44485.1 hypothetical protein A3850_008270 [Lewinella sp. 4G2]